MEPVASAMERTEHGTFTWKHQAPGDATHSVFVYRDTDLGLHTPAVCSGGLDGVIDVLGTRRFDPALLGLLHRHCGVEHCAVFQFNRGHIAMVGAASMDGGNGALLQGTRYANEGYWRCDPTLKAAQQMRSNDAVVILRIDPNRISDPRLRDDIYLDRNVIERVFICGKRSGWYFGISAVRTSGAGCFTPDQLARLATLAECVVSLAAKHAEMLCGPLEHGDALACVETIEVRLKSRYRELTDRERQGCARVLFGLTAEGIALDLGIAIETVATYRKRSYRRLKIGTRHELLRIYLGHAAAADRTDALSPLPGTDMTGFPRYRPNCMPR